MDESGDVNGAVEVERVPASDPGLGILLASAIVGFGVAFTVTLEPYPLLEAGPVLLLLLVWAVLTFSALSHAPRGERVTPTYLVMGLVPWALSALLLANGALDHSAGSTQHTVAISASRVTPLYVVRIQSWRPGRGSETLYFHRTYFGSDRQPYLTAGEPVTIGLKPGALGLPWVSSIAHP